CRNSHLAAVRHERPRKTGNLAAHLGAVMAMGNKACPSPVAHVYLSSQMRQERQKKYTPNGAMPPKETPSWGHFSFRYVHDHTSGQIQTWHDSGNLYIFGIVRMRAKSAQTKAFNHAPTAFHGGKRGICAAAGRFVGHAHLHIQLFLVNVLGMRSQLTAHLAGFKRRTPHFEFELYLACRQ